MLARTFLIPNRILMIALHSFPTRRSSDLRQNITRGELQYLPACYQQNKKSCMLARTAWIPNRILMMALHSIQERHFSSTRKNITRGQLQYLPECYQQNKKSCMLARLPWFQ